MTRGIHTSTNALQYVDVIIDTCRGAISRYTHS